MGRAVNNSDGTISLALTDTTTISPNTNYIPGTIQRSYDDSTHTYTVTATDAEPIDGLVQDGWSVVYQKTPSEDEFYSKADYTGTAIDSDNLQGNILIGGMMEVSNESYGMPTQNTNILKFKNSFITSVGSYFLGSCRGLTSVELPNLTSAGDSLLSDCSSLTSVELPNLTSVGRNFLFRGYNIRSIECPKLKSIDIDFHSSIGEPSSSSPMYFVDFGYITNANELDFYYAQVMVLRADIVPTNFAHSLLPYPVLYIVPSALVDTYKSKVRSQDYVTALEKSPFADGKTVCGNNMKTVYVYGMTGETTDLGEGTMLWFDGFNWRYVGSFASKIARLPEDSQLSGFYFLSKLTKEKGYTIPTQLVVAGSKEFLYPELENGVDFTVPDGVNVLHAVSKEFDSQSDIACTPRSVIHFGTTYLVHAQAATIGNSGKTFLILFEVTKDPSTTGFTLSWSPEINTHTPTVTDY